MSEMAGIEKPLTPAGITFQPFDLQAPERLLVSAFEPLRHTGRRTPPPRYVPVPLPDGMARVVLSDDYYLNEVWDDFRDGTSCSPGAVFDIPAEQRDRWQQAVDAYRAMQDEIRELMEARRRSPEPAKRGPYIPQP